MAIEMKRLGAADVPLIHQLNAMFGKAFEDQATYAQSRSEPEYLANTLALPHVIALAALDDQTIVGGLVAYELPKLERKASEIYIYDLAVDEAYRRQGVATSLINGVKAIGKQRGAWVVFVQGDYGDEPALALYDKLGVREEVLHFDIAVND